MVGGGGEFHPIPQRVFKPKSDFIGYVCCRDGIRKYETNFHRGLGGGLRNVSGFQVAQKVVSVSIMFAVFIPQPLGVKRGVL